MVTSDTIRINRAPVLTLWAAVVAERLGFDRATALTLGQSVAGSSAYAKGVSLGIIEPKPDLVREQSDRLAEGEQLRVDLLGRAVPVVRTPDGLRAVSKGKPGSPAQVEKYLASKFGDRLDDARQAMAELAGAGSGCTRRSGRACQLGSQAGVRWAGWIWRRYARRTAGVALKNRAVSEPFLIRRRRFPSRRSNSGGPRPASFSFAHSPLVPARLPGASGQLARSLACGEDPTSPF
jgi:hypothetical protein